MYYSSLGGDEGEAEYSDNSSDYGNNKDSVLSARKSRQIGDGSVVEKEDRI